MPIHRQGFVVTNAQYIKHRNLLIPEAEQFTNAKYGIKKWEKTDPEIRKEWSRTFLKKMNELAVAAGLCEEGSV